VIAPVKNATSAQLDRVEEALHAALDEVQQALPEGSKPIPAGELIDTVARTTGLDRGVVQMAVTVLVTAGQFMLNNRFEVTRVN
jgi:hypothetical protein